MAYSAEVIRAGRSVRTPAALTRGSVAAVLVAGPATGRAAPGDCGRAEDCGGGCTEFGVGARRGPLGANVAAAAGDGAAAPLGEGETSVEPPPWALVECDASTVFRK